MKLSRVPNQRGRAFGRRRHQLHEPDGSGAARGATVRQEDGETAGRMRVVLLAAASASAAGAGSRDALTAINRLARHIAKAALRAAEKYAGLQITTGVETPTVLLLSHVLTELNQAQTEALVSLATQATVVIWVEPGTYETSYTLIAIREKLRGEFNVVAPCTHQARCGLLAAGNERHWCHHFAAPPAEIFQDSDWSRFANLTGIDLRDLPLSFLVLDKRPAPTLPAGAARVIGHPRIYKPLALLLGCDESGVRERKLTKRAHPAEYKRLKKECDPLQVWECDGDEIVRVTKLDSSPTP